MSIQSVEHFQDLMIFYNSMFSDVSHCKLSCSRSLNNSNGLCSGWICVCDFCAECEEMTKGGHLSCANSTLY